MASSKYPWWTGGLSSLLGTNSSIISAPPQKVCCPCGMQRLMWIVFNVFSLGDLDIIFFVAPSGGSHPRSPIQGKSLPRLHHQDDAHKEPCDHPAKSCRRIDTCFSGYDSEWQGSRWRLVGENSIQTDNKLLLHQDGYPSMRTMNSLHLHAVCFTAYWWAARCVRMNLLLNLSREPQHKLIYRSQ